MKKLQLKKLNLRKSIQVVVNCQLIKLKVEKLETQEQHTSGGELPENETTCKEPKTEEKHSGGSELPKYEEPKSQGDHSSDGDIPKDEIIREENKTQEEHSSGGELPKDGITGKEPKTQEKTRTQTKNLGAPIRRAAIK